jgi:hypothetical protein
MAKRWVPINSLAELNAFETVRKRGASSDSTQHIIVHKLPTVALAVASVDITSAQITEWERLVDEPEKKVCEFCDGDDVMIEYRRRENGALMGTVREADCPRCHGTKEEPE